MAQATTCCLRFICTRRLCITGEYVRRNPGKKEEEGTQQMRADISTDRTIVDVRVDHQRPVGQIGFISSLHLDDLVFLPNPVLPATPTSQQPSAAKSFFSLSKSADALVAAAPEVCCHSRFECPKLLRCVAFQPVYCLTFLPPRQPNCPSAFCALRDGLTGPDLCKHSRRVRKRL
jgi:hypothetical protein